MSTEQRWTDLAAAYVLGALDPEERSAFEARLEQDAELQAEVDAHRELVGVLSDAVPRHAPPAALKARILDRARAEREGGGTRPIESAPSVRDAPPPGSGGAGAAGPGGVARWTPWLAAAALVAALGTGYLAQRVDQQRDALAERLESVQAQLDDARASVAERDSLLATFLGPDVRTVALSATDQPPSARIFWNTATSTIIVAAFDLPPAPEGRTYQLWGIAEGGSPVSLGTFQTAADGTALVQRTVPAGTDFQIGAVTEEPTGGSPQPTSAPFLVGTWTDA
ncbi:MAG: anti-sigma factor [Longimicrobiales bacterium]